jgi:hypothetical protein
MKKVLNIIILLVIVFGVIYFIRKDEVKVEETEEIKQILISIDNRDLIVNLEKNSSAEELYKKLKDNHVTIDAHDYNNYEKVGDLGFELPTNDEFITTKSGDLILYEGNKITLYYDTNSYKFTKLGHVINFDGMDLKDFLGSGSVKMTLSRK